MKCVKNLQTGELKRVDDETADRMCKGKLYWWYAPKSEWKAQTRKPVVAEAVEKKSDKKKSKTKSK